MIVIIIIKDDISLLYVQQVYILISDENKVIRIAKCDAFSGVCESIR